MFSSLNTTLTCQHVLIIQRVLLLSTKLCMSMCSLLLFLILRGHLSMHFKGKRWGTKNILFLIVSAF